MRFPIGSAFGTRRGFGGYGRRGGGGFSKGRLLIAGAIALFALASYFFSSQTNPVTGKDERVGNYSAAQEVQMGYAAAPEMVQQMGGAVPRDSPKQQTVERLGNELLAAPYKDGRSLQQILTEKNVPWKFTFTLIDDEQTVNAFALPGGPVFVTEALFDRLENEAQLAGVLGHEVGHVIERHGLERMASAQMMGQLGAAVGVAAEDGSGRGMNAAVLAQSFGQIFQLGYSREAELESDQIGLSNLVAAGYDPREMVRVMEILKEASGGGGRGGAPEFMQTHPHPESRIDAINAFVKEKFPDGVPDELSKGRALR